MTISVRVLTVFPELVDRSLSEGMVRIARERNALDLKAVDIRGFAEDVHRTTDDAPYGGGPGMVMMVEPVVRAWESLTREERGRPFVLSARGRPFTQELARTWSQAEAFTLLCGRYQGMDERVLDILDAEEISLGDFVLAGGELAAAVMIEAVARLLPGVLGDAQSGTCDSYEEGLLGHPDYTRPETFAGRSVPEVLLSGNHAEIAKWRRRKRLESTWKRRPDLLENASLGKEDLEFLRGLREDPPGEQGSEQGIGDKQRKES